MLKKKLILKIKNKIRNLYSNLKFISQKFNRGFSENDMWSLDDTIARFILPRLKFFKEVKSGCPSDLTEEQWNEILDEMIKYFEYVLTEDYYILLQDDPNRKGLELFCKYFEHLWY